MTGALLGAQHAPNGAQRSVRRFAATRPGAWLLARTLRHVDRVCLRLSAGRLTGTSVLAGLPAIALVTIGARSGKRRSTTVLGIPVGEQLAVVAGNFGQPRPPAWMHNLLEHPEATIEVGRRSVDVIARPVADSERRSVLDAAVALYPPYASYFRWIEGRVVALFILEPRRSP